MSGGDTTESPEIKVREVYRAEYWEKRAAQRENLESCSVSPSGIQHSADQCMYMRKLLEAGGKYIQKD